MVVQTYMVIYPCHAGVKADQRMTLQCRSCHRKTIQDLWNDCIECLSTFGQSHQKLNTLSKKYSVCWGSINLVMDYFSLNVSKHITMKCTSFKVSIGYLSNYYSKLRTQVKLKQGSVNSIFRSFTLQLIISQIIISLQLQRIHYYLLEKFFDQNTGTWTLEKLSKSLKSSPLLMSMTSFCGNEAFRKH